MDGSGDEGMAAPGGNVGFEEGLRVCAGGGGWWIVFEGKVEWCDLIK